MTRILVVRNLIRHTAFACTIRGCSSMWVRLNRLDSSAVVRNIGSLSWGARRSCRLCCRSNMILSNLQQFVTSLNRMSSEVMRVAFDREPFPSEAVQTVAPAHRVRRAAHYMGWWRPPSTQGIHGPLPSSSVTSVCPVQIASRISHSSALRLWCFPSGDGMECDGHCANYHSRDAIGCFM